MVILKSYSSSNSHLVGGESSSVLPGGEQSVKSNRYQYLYDVSCTAEHFSCHPTSFSHGFNLFSGFDLYHPGLRRHFACPSICRKLNSPRDQPGGTNPVTQLTDNAVGAASRHSCR